MSRASPAAGSFTYVGFDAAPATGRLACRYRVGDVGFVETYWLPPAQSWSDATWEAARLLFLLAGVSYYKTTAPGVVDLGSTSMLPGELDLLRSFVVDGLGELALRNGLDLRGVEIVGGAPAQPPARAMGAPGGPPGLAPVAAVPARPLVPFGGGIDSIVSVELLRRAVPDVSLFVASPAGDRFAAIEGAAAASGLPVVRARRVLDEKVLRPAEHGYLIGHVPVTGILSALAALCALLEGRDAVVMSNERSASEGNIVTERGGVNHQWSKSWAFESGLAAVLHQATGGAVSYLSLLRPWSELWIARRFAHATSYHSSFRSCNRAFYLDPAKRLDRWCAVCDKCCFVDLVLAPFLSPGELAAIFGGREPLANPALRASFLTLLGASEDSKPWECVGDTDECRAALVLAADRPDRAATELLHELVRALGEGTAAARASLPALLAPAGPHRVPDALLPAA